MVVAFSDSYAGLFTLGTEVNILQAPPDTALDYEVDGGKLASDDYQFVISDAAILTAADTACRDMILAAQTAGVLRYVALFINDTCHLDPAVRPNIANADFVGVITTDMRSKDLAWFNSRYNEETQAWREWTVRAKSHIQHLFEKIKFTSLIDGDAPNFITGFDASWITNYVADRLGYYSLEGRQIRYSKLVSLNRILLRLLTNCSSSLQNMGYPAYTFTITDVQLDFMCSPSIATTPEVPADLYGSGHRTRYTTLATTHGWNNSELYWRPINQAVYPKLGSAAIQTYNDMYVDWMMYAKPEAGTNNYEGISCRRYGTLWEYLHALAFTFGCYLRFSITGENTFAITFVPRSTLANSTTVRIADASSVELETTYKFKTKQERAAELVVGYPNAFTVEGVDQLDGSHKNDVYELDWPHSAVLQSEARKTTTSGISVAHTIGAPFAKLTSLSGADYYSAYAIINSGWQYLAAHVTFYEPGQSAPWDSSWGSPVNSVHGPCSLIFMPFLSAVLLGQHHQSPMENVWLPIGWIHAKVDGKEREWISFSSYLNEMDSRDQAFYETELSIEVDSVESFLPAAGGSPSWKNIGIGYKYSYAGKSYVIVGLKRLWGQGKTQLRCRSNTQYSIAVPAQPSGASVTVYVPPNADKPAAMKGSGYVSYTVGEDVKADDALCFDYVAGLAYRMSADTRSRYDGFIGIASSDAASGTTVNVFPPDTAAVLQQSFTIGTLVYVRNATYPASNITGATPTLSNPDVENVVTLLGRVAEDSHLLYLEPTVRPSVLKTYLG